MRLSVNGSFLSKPLSGIGRYACEMATALKVMDVSCHFLHTKPVHPTFEQYMEDINMQKSIRSSDIFGDQITDFPYLYRHMFQLFYPCLTWSGADTLKPCACARSWEKICYFLEPFTAQILLHVSAINGG